MTKADDIVTSAQPAEMTHHHVVRDGSVWLCIHCLGTWPFPSPLPDTAGPCVPRRWEVDR
jgi:hypothetical protein